MKPVDPLSDDFLLNMTSDQARDLSRDPAQAEWALLRLQAIANAAAQDASTGSAAPAPDPSTPSSMMAPYAKQPGKKKPKPRGRPAGHAGARRAAPVHIDRRVEHKLKNCPDCGGKVTKRGKPRTRIIEDIAPTGPEATEHAINNYYCPCCKKRVEPRVADAPPKCAVGNRAIALTSWLHYGLGNTVSQIQDVLSKLFQLPVSPGGLTHMWARLAEAFRPWADQIAEAARGAAVLNADETGWRVNGKTHWLWCFTAPGVTYYEIDKSRGHGALLAFIGETFAGTLVSDFFGAYNKIAADRRQVCMAHLLREIKKVSERNSGEDWSHFAKPLKKLLKDALRLAKRADRDADDYASKRARIKQRLDDLCFGPLVRGDDARRIMKRLTTFQDYLFTFLDDIAVPPDNNRAEREIRPAVIARKNSFHNTSDRGAATQAALMSIHRTLKLRGRDPIAELAAALRAHTLTGTLPPLPGAHHPVADSQSPGP